MLVAVERVAGKDRNRGKHFTTFMTNITSNKQGDGCRKVQFRTGASLHSALL